MRPLSSGDSGVPSGTRGGPCGLHVVPLLVSRVGPGEGAPGRFFGVGPDGPVAEAREKRH